MSNRSSKIILTNEARVLRELRLLNGMSMKDAGKIAGLSDSMIAHIETGRIDPPKDERLERLLGAYGGIKTKSFYERVRRHHEKLTPRDELLQLIERFPNEKINLLLPMIKALAG